MANVPHGAVRSSPGEPPLGLSPARHAPRRPRGHGIATSRRIRNVGGSERSNHGNSPPSGLMVGTWPAEARATDRVALEGAVRPPRSVARPIALEPRRTRHDDE